MWDLFDNFSKIHFKKLFHKNNPLSLLAEVIYFSMHTSAYMSTNKFCHIKHRNIPEWFKTASKVLKNALLSFSVAGIKCTILTSQKLLMHFDRIVNDAKQIKYKNEN